MLTPLVSVVLPVKNQCERLRVTLAALEAQRDLDPDDIEVIVVDDGSSDALREVIDDEKPRAPYELRATSCSSGGARGVPRNAGARLARGDVLVFLDADACPSRELLRRHVDAQQERDALALGDCHVIADTESLRDPSSIVGADAVRSEGDGALERRARKGIYPGMEAWQRGVEAMLVAASRFAWLGGVPHNLSVRRSSLVRAGGFDPFMRHAEGFDLALRAGRVGCGTRFVHRARSYHLHHRRDVRGQNEHLEDAQRLLCARYPQDGVEAAFLWMCALAGDPLVPAELGLDDWRTVEEMHREPSGGALLRNLWAHRARATRPPTLLDCLASDRSPS